MVQQQDFHPGRLDVSDKYVMFHRFLVSMRYIVLACVVMISFLVIAFCGGNWATAIVVAVIELAVGLYFARDRKRVTWASEAGALFTSTAAEEEEALAVRRAEAQGPHAQDRAA